MTIWIGSDAASRYLLAKKSVQASVGTIVVTLVILYWLLKETKATIQKNIQVSRSQLSTHCPELPQLELLVAWCPLHFVLLTSSGCESGDSDFFYSIYHWAKRWWLQKNYYPCTVHGELLILIFTSSQGTVSSSITSSLCMWSLEGYVRFNSIMLVSILCYFNVCTMLIKFRLCVFTSMLCILYS